MVSYVSEIRVIKSICSMKESFYQHRMNQSIDLSKLKGTVHQNMTGLQFTHPHVVANLNEHLSSVIQHEGE